MKLKSKLSTLLSLTVTCGALSSVGCDVTERDVTAARDEVVEEQRETAEVQRESQEIVRQRQQELANARYQANRPNYDQDHIADDAENVIDAEQDLVEAEREAAENIAEERRETEAAHAEANQMAQKLEATKARDAYVAELETQLEIYDKQIEAEVERTHDLTGAELEAVQTEIESMRVNREALKDAINDVEGADVMMWESQKVIAEQASDRIDQDLQ